MYWNFCFSFLASFGSFCCYAKFAKLSKAKRAVRIVPDVANAAKKNAMKTGKSPILNLNPSMNKHARSVSPQKHH